MIILQPEPNSPHPLRAPPRLEIPIPIPIPSAIASMMRLISRSSTPLLVKFLPAELPLLIQTLDDIDGGAARRTVFIRGGVAAVVLGLGLAVAVLAVLAAVIGVVLTLTVGRGSDGRGVRV